ncbi:hypothetical protein C0992_004009 [Termitomyces sp. T32_za158]|nr:hypothetical protein C0992_004009 [Termitomyces sp. T32_za158]
MPPLHLAVEHGGDDGISPLHVAAQNGQLEILRLLLEHHADTNLKNYMDQLPLHLAAQNNHLDIVNVLIIMVGQHFI